MKNFPIPVRSFLLFVALFLGGILSSQAQSVSVFTQRLAGSQLVPNATATTMDSVYYDAAIKAKLESAYPVKNIVTFKLDEYSSAYPSGPFTATAVIKITYSGADNNSYSIQDTLSINYDTTTTYRVRNSFVFNNAHKVTVQLLSLTSSNTAMNAALVLENEMRVSAIYKFDIIKDTVTSISFTTTGLPANPDQILVTWPWLRGVDEYDLEWAYVDSTALTNSTYGNPIKPALLFRNNATRVSVDSNRYRIPLMYDNGGVLFARVRGVQVRPGGQRIEGAWTGNYPGNVARYSFKGHENMLNWQSNISYAEDGKRKVVVQYFDGILKSRQTVTKDNSTDTTLVAETLYDKQGRPVIEVLPAPSLSNIIGYTRGFNTGINGAYDVSRYDTLTSPAVYLSTSALPMDSSNGASRYYSSNNNRANDPIHRYIPRAGGFPFTETVYTPDNTGRISRQSGVGPDHTINSGHETRYSYGSPSQRELDILFGTEAGDASHYFKNGVRDANGQYSFSYVDMHGRTVATSLAGVATGANLKKLSSDLALMTVDTLGGVANNSIRDRVMTVHKSLIVPVDGQYDFNYVVGAPVLKKKDCNNADVLYRAKMDLEIKITDNEFNQLLPGKQPVIYRASNVLDTSPQDSLRIKFSIVLQAGSYEITKTLKINDGALDNYRENIYLAGSVCTSLQKLIDEQRKLLINSNCVPDSLSCIASVGDRISFITKYMQQINRPLSDTGQFIGDIDNAYKSALAACSMLRGQYTQADSRRNAMLGDMTPPSGQYANMDGSMFPYSIFYSDGNVGPIYKRKDITYLGPDKKPVLVYDETSNIFVKPQDLSPQQFVEKFQASWAEALLPFHPEYCRLQVFESFKSGLVWDNKFRDVDTYAEAKNAKFLNPAGGQTGVFAPYAQTEVVDPLLLNNPALRTDLLNRMTVIPKSNNSSIYKLAAIATLCIDPRETNCIDQFNDNTNVFNPALCTGDLNMLWRNFREQYLNIKQEMMNAKIAEVSCITNGMPVNMKMLFDSGKVVHFGTQEDYFANSKDMSPYTEMKSGDIGKMSDSANIIAKRLYAENCNAYVNVWMKQLASCNYTASEWNTIKSQLLEVCKAGADADHPYGASSVPVTNTTLANRSFEDVIRNFNNANPGPTRTATSQFLITIPSPYYAQGSTSNKPLITAPSDCECAKLDSVKREYDAAKIGQESLADYIFRTSKVKMSQIDLENLLTACHPATACSYMDKLVYVPPAFQCNTAPPCTNCKVVNSLIATYKATYGDAALPILQGKPNAPVWDTTEQQKGDRFAAYMNNRLGYGLSYVDYLNFKDSCDMLQFKDTVYSLKNNPINPIELSYQGAKLKVFITDVKPTMDNCYLLAGMTASDSRPVLVKTNGKGDVIWSKGYQTYYSSNYITTVVPLRDSGILLAGHIDAGGNASFMASKQASVAVVEPSMVTDSLSGTSDSSTTSRFVALNAEGTSHSFGLIFIKVDKNGNFVWSKVRYNDTTNTGYNLRDVIELSNNDIAFVGGFDAASTAITGTVGVLDKFGTGKWMKNIVKPTITQQLIEDGDNLVVAGIRVSAGGNFNPTLSKYSKQNGSLVSYKEYSFGSHTELNALYKRPGGGYRIVMTAFPTSSSKNGAGVILNVNNSLDVVNAFQLSTPQGKTTRKVGSYQLPDGSLYLSQFSTDSINGGYNLMIDNQGVVVWSRKRNTTDSSYILKVMPYYDGSLVGAGWHRGNPVIFQYDNMGKQVCDDVADNITSTNVTFTAAASTPGISNLSATTNSLSINPLIYTAVTNRLNCSSGNVGGITVYRGPLLCAQSEPSFKPVSGNTTTSCSDSSLFIISAATEIFKAVTDSLRNDFDQAYISNALTSINSEKFSVGYRVNEYHYTLYYYDQAGNLVKTVPPAGVVVDTNRSWLNSVDSARKVGGVKVPPHKLVTTYRYNTLNQVVSQQSPDGGNSLFWYDRLGRLAVSQNAQQRKGSLYSYTLYDPLGRITEVGQIKSTAAMTNTISQSVGQLQQWLTTAAGTKAQITQTVYDTANTDISAELASRNLRNRVSWSAVYNVAADMAPRRYSNATYYSYDIHGNVDTLLQDFQLTSMQQTGRNRFKKIVYEYDLVSGKVNKVAYQPGNPDAFYHRYLYDAENRITNVETSTDDVYYENEAYYQYYKHGPLARAVVGQQQVQGLDYAYTLQGWLKGVNSSTLSPSFDMGGDGASNTKVARDAFGYSLHYYGDKDYRPIGNRNVLGAGTASNAALFNPLYNGNIAAMGVNITGAGQPLLYHYQYDVLNRLRNMTASTGLNQASNTWAPSAISDFAESVDYDGNGNIKTYSRNGNKTFANMPLGMDSMTYSYIAGTNKLSYIDDSVPASNYGTDIDKQAAGNYTYDAIGNMTIDKASGIDSIVWSVYGKILEIRKKNDSTIYYTYDAAGNRISKRAKGIETWYVRDATGNILSTYVKNDPGFNSGKMTLTEHSLYGSSRLGIINRNVNVEIVNTPPIVPLPTIGTGINTIFNRGDKIFELSNHLGNVLATVSDRKKPISLNGTSIDHFDPIISTAQDYYPFGSLMPGRGGRAITGGWIDGSNTVNGYTLPANLALSSRAGNQPNEYVASSTIEFLPGFNSADGDDFTAYIADGSYAGGSGGSSVNGGGGYRYGFNGKENDNEVKGEGNQLDFGARVYDPRIGRFFSTDPLMQKYAALSPYIYALDNPISHLDVEGAEGVNFNEGKPKPNTIIIIATEMEIKGPLSPTNTAASKAHHGQWNVILATSMIDAESQMKKYYGDSKAKNVVIHSHGTTDDKARFVFGTGEQSGRFSPEVLQAYVDNPKNEDGKGLKRLPEVHYNNAVAFNGIINMIEDKGNLVIAACHAGKGDEGNEMGKVLHEIAPNINIYLNSDYSTYHTYAGFGYGVGQTAGNPTGQLTDKSDLSGGWRKVDQNGKITNLKARSNDGNLIINTKEQPAITPSKKESSQLTKPKS